MKRMLLLTTAVGALLASQALAQDTATTTPAAPAAPAAPTPAPKPAPPAPAPAPPATATATAVADVTTPAPAEKPKLSPQDQIAAFYKSFADERAQPGIGKAREGLLRLLTSNPTLTPQGIEQIAVAIQGPLRTVGDYLDYEVTRETKITKRTQVVRVIAHFTNQPFMNEFTFYQAEDGYWQLLNLRYDANPATIVADELRSAN